MLKYSLIKCLPYMHVGRFMIFISVFNLINSVPDNVYNPHVYAN